ncbi:hypothetical protein BKA62DRAFT_687707 [Auriculariales sp. MPI-PUGE-AT-0066]|nr:hypothetical protein BKA62DRAFT_687707 [Auriculariales sp. MPI-PUGE-AT-0066]
MSSSFAAERGYASRTTDWEDYPIHYLPLPPETWPGGPEPSEGSRVAAPPRPEQPNPDDLSLMSLQAVDPREKPPYPLPTLITCAILGSERKMLTLDEIYEAVEERFAWFKSHTPFRVRHNLSLNAMFVKQPRPITSPGKGNYLSPDWAVKDGAILGVAQGTKRPRTRKRMALPIPESSRSLRTRTTTSDRPELPTVDNFLSQSPYQLDDEMVTPLQPVPKATQPPPPQPSIPSRPTASRSTNADTSLPPAPRPTPMPAAQPVRAPLPLQDRTTVPRTTGPRTIEYRRTTEPRTTEIRTTEPRTTGTRTTEPRTTDPRTTDPRTTELRTTEPRTAGPRTTDARRPRSPALAPYSVPYAGPDYPKSPPPAPYEPDSEVVFLPLDDDPLPPRGYSPEPFRSPVAYHPPPAHQLAVSGSYPSPPRMQRELRNSLSPQRDLSPLREPDINISPQRQPTINISPQREPTTNFSPQREPTITHTSSALTRQGSQTAASTAVPTSSYSTPFSLPPVPRVPPPSYGTIGFARFANRPPAPPVSQRNSSADWPFARRGS